MRAPVSDGEVSAMGGWARGPSFLSLELPVRPNETWRSSCPEEGAVM